MQVINITQKEGDYSLLELGIVIVIICILLFLSISYYQPLRNRALVTRAVEELRYERNKSSLFYQVKGRWPNEREMASLNLKRDNPYSTIKREDILQQPGSGAMTVVIRELPQEANQVTLRPALSPEDGRGTITWLCGNKPIPGNGAVYGKNATTIDLYSLPSFCR